MKFLTLRLSRAPLNRCFPSALQCLRSKRIAGGSLAQTLSLFLKVEDTDAYFTRFTSSSIVTGQSKKTDPRIELLAKKLNVGRNRNANYLGSITAFDVLNAVTAEKDNCALYLTKLPMVITTKEVYAQVKHGAIHSSSLMRPNSPTHRYSAMRLVFMKRAGAEAFMEQARSFEGLIIGGERIEAYWNRERVGPAGLERYQRMTRVLRIESPVAGDMDMDETLLPLLRQSFKFELIDKSQTVITTKGGEEKKLIVLEFASIRGQADSAYVLLKQLRKSIAKRSHDFSVSFAPDPCDARSGDSVHVSQTPRKASYRLPDPSLSAWRPSPKKS